MQFKDDSGEAESPRLNFANRVPFSSISRVPHETLGLDAYDDEPLKKLAAALRSGPNDASVSRWISIQRITSPTSGLIPIITTHLRNFSGLARELWALIGVLKDADVEDSDVTTCVSALSRVREASPDLLQPCFAEDSLLPLALCRASGELIGAIDQCKSVDLREQFRADVMDEMILASHYGSLGRNEKARLYQLI